jgi:hypothetical protein
MASKLELMKAIAILIAMVVLNGCAMVQYGCTGNWDDSIKNPNNEEYVTEIAFNLGIDNNDVTQEMFNERYINQ